MAIVETDPQAPDFVRRLPNLADPRLGARAVAASDEFFAPRDRMLSPEPAVFIPGKYDDHGKWMDGWETRRKRGQGHDWCIVRLARRARILGVDIDTSHFTGNYPPGASLDVCQSADEVPSENTVWTPLLPVQSLAGNSHHYRAIDNDGLWTHVRISIYPDGGIARLRVHGQPVLEAGADEIIDLAAAINGASVVAANNEHFGRASALLLPGRGVNMGDGWETRRRREPGNDWSIIALAQPGVIERIEVDTAHFKGNFPDACSLQAAFMPAATEQTLVTQSMFWSELLAPQKLKADAVHVFELPAGARISHVRFNIFPDGGVSRLRLFGRRSQA
ncbi:MAG: allantoicase [Candidatus Dactylopiibacterium carminicum]|uniref:Probable allantoicase n=1 Tax=Candidatus Dactylopiibacterium carminicum TaxID=857335 RepID=A0A272EPI1_9RHOO|nr:allantoicase [Candidatus Dactylopiibacterium carminicum]KAF7599136.1 allantoicase [Candidatus Dactylopiibacterium carminicum]PAS91991.1 MAG: allantoicase [Candidatus Dactylopiibacterium carminicum]PAS99154.1 MAG: allantoicase [Candidatus Dactylopiibacterium carminicum]